QATEVACAAASSTAWRTSLVRNPFVSPELCPSDAMASSRSIYTTTPLEIGKASLMSSFFHTSYMKDAFPISR
ncbi:MAG: hypothetical protein VB140_01245, partial [Burkholderia sp.]